MKNPLCIIATALLTLALGEVCVLRYMSTHAVGYRVGGVAAIVIIVGLLVYLVRSLSDHPAGDAEKARRPDEARIPMGHGQRLGALKTNKPA